jgi:hypothetical protein
MQSEDKMKVWVERDQWYPVFFIATANRLQTYLQETEIDEELKQRIDQAEKEFLACQEIMKKLYDKSKGAK